MLAESNRVAIVPIVPNRGVITDRNGIVLAQSYSAYTLELTPAKIRNLEATIDELATIVDIQPRDRKRFKKLLDESKNFESMPLRTRLTDEEVARFAVNRYRFPGVEIKARLFRQYPYGEVASHVIGYIGRVTERDLERIASWDETANYKGSDYIGKVGVELSYERELHGTTAWKKSRSTPAAAPCARSRARRRCPATTCACRSTSSCRSGRAGVRRPPRRAGRDRSFHRRHPRVRQQAGLRPEPVRRRHRSRELGGAQRFAGQAALNRPLRGAYPPGRRSSRSSRSAR
jgi:hypothetical protein